MTTPSFIYNADLFRSLVKLGETTETLVLEFKAALPDGWKATDKSVKLEARKEQARDIAQFANTFGGVLIYGIREKEKENGQYVADSLVSISEIDRSKKWILDSARRFLVPNTISMQMSPFEIDGTQLLVVNVPASRAPIAVWDHHCQTIQYICRNDYGKQSMDPDNAIHFMLDRSRAAMIGLHRIHDELVGKKVTPIYVDLVGFVARSKYGPADMTPNILLRKLEDNEFLLEINSYEVRVPYGLVREAWHTSSSRLGLMLDVGVRIVYDTINNIASIDVIG